jgi:hypothetical protein
MCGSGERRSVAVGLYRSEPYDLQVPGLKVSRLSINLTASRVTGGVESDRSRTFDASRHSMFFSPAATSMRWRKPSPSRHLNIYFHPGLDADNDDLADHLEGAGPMFNVSLSGSGALVVQLAAEMSAAGRSPGKPSIAWRACCWSCWRGGRGVRRARTR